MCSGQDKLGRDEGWAALVVPPILVVFVPDAAHPRPAPYIRVHQDSDETILVAAPVEAWNGNTWYNVLMNTF